ncbi:hypothetical protein FQP85_08345 [Pseudoalteromonas neustonica]|uniref:DotU family type IV/VI secretion system protein n=1 Tax=Pseudoalteromonas neustonica TaxID=1840331 RepID=A0ABY3FE72_9GAMM|nr:hypothetical protein [Pseudoalteromonas neustonica]TVU83775.1 hypothetical protein FQP85_08345 [Pseudoalteromonas neustonica]
MNEPKVSRYPVEKLLIFIRRNPSFNIPDSEFDLRRYPNYETKVDRLLCLLEVEYSGLDYKKKYERITYFFESMITDKLVYDRRFYANKTLFNGLNKEKKEVKILLKTYAFTAAGLELVLKIEAHNDAERRHNDTHKHNTLMRWIAGSSFLLSFIAVSVSGFLAYVANKNMELNQQRLEIQQQQIKSIYEKVNSENDDMTKQE